MSNLPKTAGWQLFVKHKNKREKNEHIIVMEYSEVNLMIKFLKTIGFK